jgi:5,10-methylenetetrahydromethanopterin reductase
MLRRLSMTGRVKFGVGFAPSMAAPKVVETARLAEQLGYDVFWLTDSHLISREVMTLLGALAVATERIELGPGVSHLAGRHPSVIASAMATLDELAPGRARLGIGVGDSGALNLGVPKATLRQLEAAVVDIRALLDGHEVDGAARSIRLTHAPTANQVPIYVAGASERTHQMSGRVADGALISGMPDELETAIRAVRAGEREAGRQPGSTRILLWTTVCVNDELEAARAAVRGAVARRAMNSYGRLARLGQLDADDLEALTRLEREYDTRHHGLAGQALSDLVPERWIDRFAIVGPPHRVRSRIEQAIDQGADEVSMILMGPTPNERGGVQQLHRFAEAVLMPIRDAVTS